MIEQITHGTLSIRLVTNRISTIQEMQYASK
ncbi:hypothetical protein MCEMAEM21_01143 [Oxalobacteraceae bacterium]